MKKFAFEITLQNGDEIYNSVKTGKLYATKEEADDACDDFLDGLVNVNDPDDEDAFGYGDYRTKVFEVQSYFNFK